MKDPDLFIRSRVAQNARSGACFPLSASVKRRRADIARNKISVQARKAITMLPLKVAE